MRVKTIILLHGWASKVERWEKIKQRLEKQGYKVLLPLLPGFNNSPLTKSWNLVRYVSWLEEFLTKKQIKNFILLGHSFGGSIALKFASKKPTGLEKLILVNSSGIRKTKMTFKKLFFLFFAKTGKALFLLPPFCLFKKPARWLLYTLAREKDYYQADKVMKRTMRKVLKEDLRKILPQVNVETLLIWGAKDKMTPLDNAKLMQTGIANSQLVVYDNVGHGLPFKKTKKFIQTVIKFIQA